MTAVTSESAGVAERRQTNRRIHHSTDEQFLPRVNDAYGRIVTAATL